MNYHTFQRSFTTPCFFLLAVLFSTLAFLDGSYAQCHTGGSPTCTLVAGSGTVVTIDKHGTCRRVTNNNSGTIAVFHNISSEWSNFISYPPANTVVSSCGSLCWVCGGNSQYGPSGACSPLDATDNGTDWQGNDWGCTCSWC